MLDGYAERTANLGQLGIAVLGMLAAGFTTWGITYQTIKYNGDSIIRVEQKFDLAFRDLATDRAGVRAKTDAEFAELWATVRANTSAIHDTTRLLTNIPAIEKKIDDERDLREQRFQQSAAANQEQTAQLHDIANDMKSMVRVVQQMVICLQQPKGCSNFTMPFPYSGEPVR